MSVNEWVCWMTERIIAAEAVGDYERAEQMRLQMELLEEALISPALTCS